MLLATDELVALALEEVVDSGGLAGAVAALWRGGAKVQHAAVGWLDREAGLAMRPERAATSICRGAPGTVGWPGTYGGWWQADPSAGTAAVFLTHSLVERDQLAVGVGLDVYGAIESVADLFA